MTKIFLYDIKKIVIHFMKTLIKPFVFEFHKYLKNSSFKPIHPEQGKHGTSSLLFPQLRDKREAVAASRKS